MIDAGYPAVRSDRGPPAPWLGMWVIGMFGAGLGEGVAARAAVTASKKTGRPVDERVQKIANSRQYANPM